MAEPFIGEIRMFGGTFAPRSYAFCNGQLLSIGQNEALFSLVGTTFGGDGQSTFGLPDFRGRVPVGQGQGPGLSPRSMGEAAGSETVTLVAAQVPAHNHSVACGAGGANSNSPTGNFWASDPGAESASYSPPTTINTTMAPGTVSPSGESQPQPHANIQPYLAISFIIALEGVFPSRN